MPSFILVGIFVESLLIAKSGILPPKLAFRVFLTIIFFGFAGS